MLKWVQAILPKMQISNLKSDWYNGQNLLHLIHEIKPDKVPSVSTLDPRKAVSNCSLAIRTAKHYLNVPIIIDPVMLANGEIDELSMMTYLSYFVKPASKSIIKLVRSLLPRHKIDNLTSDWNSGIMFAALLESLFPGSFPKWKDLPDSTPAKNLEKVVEASRKCCDIESPIDSRQLSNENVDELSVMTYVLRMLYASYKIMPERVNVTGPGISEASCGRNTFFIVDTTKAGPGELVVKVQHTNDTAMNVVSNEKTRGVTKFSYTPKKPGVISINISFSGSLIPSSPFTFSVDDTSSFRILDREQFVSDIDLGETFIVKLDASSVNKGTLTARLVYQSHPPVTPTITKDDNGIFTISTLAKYTGLPTLRFYWNKEEIRTCALQCTVVDIRSYKILQSSHKSTYLTFEVLDFYIEASENILFDPLKLMAINEGIHIPFELFQIYDNKGHAQFTPTLPGVYSIHVTCIDKDIEGSPFPVSVVDPAKCMLLAKPPKFLALNQEFEFLVNAVEAGVAAVGFTSENASLCTAAVNEIENLLFRVMIQPIDIGETMLSITHCNVDVPGSPFRVNICDPSECKMSGALIDTRMCTAGTVVKFTVSNQNSFTIRPVVKVQGPTARYPVKISSLDNQNVIIEFTPWEIGEHRIDATLGTFHIEDSPLLFTAEKTTTENCTASGKGLQEALSGIPAQFIIFANKSGLIESNGIEIKIQNMIVNGKCKVRARDNNDGTYNIAYLTEQPGSYLIYINVLGRTVPGSPFRVSILPGPLSFQCKVQSKALDRNAIFKIGEPIEFKVNTKNAGNGKLDVTAVGARGIQARVFTTPKDYKGNQDIQVDPSKPGKYRIGLKWGGKHIPQSPFHINVFPGADASKCKAYGPGIETAVTQQKATFTIETQDAGSGVLRVSMSGGVKIDIKPMSSLDIRSLAAEYYPKKAGDHLISIKWSEKEISGSPFRVRILQNDDNVENMILPGIPEEEDSENELTESNSLPRHKKYLATESKVESTFPNVFKNKIKSGYQKEFETEKKKLIPETKNSQRNINRKKNSRRKNKSK